MSLAAAPAKRRARLPALDWMRGLVMVLMTVDHASGAFNAQRLVTDSTFLYPAGTALPAAQFYTRWVTHLCAPTFLFLAGTALALSLERRTRAGEPARAIDRHLLVRGLVIALLDPLLISRFWGPGVILQVLYAIGLSLILMIPLRRLGDRSLLGVAALLFVGGEALAGLALLISGEPSVPGALLVHPGMFGWLLVIYPVLPWLAMMLVGWVFGRRLLDEKPAIPALVSVGAAALAAFVLVRGLDGYGNMRLYRDDGSLIQWLHVSKYPPSLSFALLEIGLMALVLAALFAVQDRVADRVGRHGPLTVFGQTALFFYVLHIPLLELAARALGMHDAGGLPETFTAALVTLVVLHPACWYYRRYKAAHPRSVLRYL